MRQFGSIFAGASLLALAGCATQGDVRSLQQDMDELKTRMFQTEKELRGVKTEAREGIEQSLKGMQGDVDAVRKGVADLQAQNDALKVEQQVLTGKLDDLRILAQKPADDIALLKEDLENRLAPLMERLQKVETELTEMKRQATEAKAQEMERTPEVLYQRSLDAYKASDMAKAREMFQRFLELHPKHELAANARYWIGETYYSEKNFEQAILEFQDVIKNFPASDKVPAAMLKQGMAFREIGDVKSARFVLKKLVDEYPDSPEAKKAAEKLKELK
ncbi:MAG: tol-pal system protein YbgF [Geobacter sp.]|nr:tol-pal system protein YbgF [Geobacter sp.]